MLAEMLARLTAFLGHATSSFSMLAEICEVVLHLTFLSFWNIGGNFGSFDHLSQHVGFADAQLAWNREYKRLKHIIETHKSFTCKSIMAQLLESKPVERNAKYHWFKSLISTELVDRRKIGNFAKKGNYLSCSSDTHQSSTSEIIVWDNCQFSFLGICNLKVSAPFGFIESPNYPNDYPRSSQCAWVIDFGPGIYVNIEFTNFILEEKSASCFDYVSLHNGSTQSSPLVQGTSKYCGTTKPPNLKHLGPLTIYFASDKDTAKTGFAAYYKTWGRNTVLRIFVSGMNLCLICWLV